ncbi:MAG: TlpA disulfide reductase family protein, partial [Bacteroidota bacterium]
FDVVDLNDNNFSSEELKGKVIVINFWFINCKPCIAEIPELNKIVEKYASNEEVVFLAFTIDKKDAIQQFTDSHPFDYNIIPSSINIIKENGVRGFPSHLVVNQDEVIVYASEGLSPITINSIEQTLAKILDK